MTEPTPRPLSAPALRPAAVILVFEGLGAAGYGVLEAAETDSRRLIVGLGAGALLVAYGLALGLLARGLWRGRRWSRGPVVATQLIQLLLAWSFRDGGTAWVAGLLGLAAAIVLVCVFLPASTAVLTSPRPGGSGPDGGPGSGSGGGFGGTDD